MQDQQHLEQLSLNLGQRFRAQYLATGHLRGPSNMQDLARVTYLEGHELHAAVGMQQNTPDDQHHQK